RVLALFLLVRRRRLGRIARRLVRPLKLHHQLNQLVLAQALQISAVHTPWIQRLESLARATRKSPPAPPTARSKWRWVIAGDQPRRHWHLEASRPHRREPARAGARRALRLCHDGEIPRSFWARLLARTARRRAPRGRGAFAKASGGHRS